MLNASVLDQYPGVDTDAVQALLEEKCRQDRHKIIVLDDDPTGVQTVHDVSVYTDWSYDSIKKGFEEDGKLFYILTNSGDLPWNRPPGLTWKSGKPRQRCRRKPELTM